MQHPDRNVPPKIERFFDIDPGRTERLELPNGATLYLCGETAPQDVVRLDLMVRGGRWHQQRLLQASYTNKMLQEGTRGKSSRQIAELLDSHGAWTDFSCSLLHSYATLYTMGKYFEPMATLLNEMMSEPSFDEEELKLQTAIGKQNLMVAQSRPAYQAKMLLTAMMFGETHPAAHYATVDDYAHLTPSVLRAFYDTYYIPQNTSVLLSGKVDQRTVDIVAGLFGTTTKAGTRTALHGLHGAPSPKVTTFEKRSMPDASQVSLRMGLFVPGRDNEDYYKLHILTTIFGGYFGSRLMQNIREDKGYTYGISSNLVSYPDETVLSIASEVNSKCVDETIREVKAEMSRLREELVGDEELAMVKNYLMGELMRSFDGQFYTADARIFLLELGLDDSYYAKAIETLRTVTAEDLRETARRYYDTGSLKVAIAGNV